MNTRKTVLATGIALAGIGSYLGLTQFGKINTPTAETTVTRTPQSTQLVFSTTGSERNEELGKGVGFAGDFNGDGTEDFIIGSPGVSRDKGKATVYSGQTSQPLKVFNGEAEGDRFGRAADSAGDFNGDGKSDIIIGAPTWQQGAGKAYVYGGATGQDVLFSIAGRPGDNLGERVVGRFDFNKDGIGDVAVAARYFDSNGSNKGAIYVYGGPNGQLLFSKTGDFTDQELGGGLSRAGDFNNDGFDDIIVGGFRESTAYVYGGPNGQLLFSKKSSEGTKFGLAVGSAGDFDHDGFDDVVVGDISYNNNTGKIYVYAGPDGSRLLFSAAGEAASGNFGHWVTTAGDYNGDGYDDIFISARDYMVGRTKYGKIYVYGGPNGKLLYSAVGPDPDSSFSANIAGGSVIFGSFPNLLVGGFSYSSSKGRTYLFAQ